MARKKMQFGNPKSSSLSANCKKSRLFAVKKRCSRARDCGRPKKRRRCSRRRQHCRRHSLMQTAAVAMNTRTFCTCRRALFQKSVLFKKSVRLRPACMRRNIFCGVSKLKTRRNEMKKAARAAVDQKKRAAKSDDVQKSECARIFLLLFVLQLLCSNFVRVMPVRMLLAACRRCVDRERAQSGDEASFYAFCYSNLNAKAFLSDENWRPKFVHRPKNCMRLAACACEVYKHSVFTHKNCSPHRSQLVVKHETKNRQVQKRKFEFIEFFLAQHFLACAALFSASRRRRRASARCASRCSDDRRR